MGKFPSYRIGDICRLEKGQTGIASATPGPYPLVTTSTERKSSSTFQFDLEAVCIPLVSSTGHGKKTLSTINYQSGKFDLGTIVGAVIPKDPSKVKTAYLHRYLQFYKDRLLVPLMKGAANVSLSLRDIATVEIELPDPKTQERFIKLFDSAHNHSELLAAEFSDQGQLTEKLRQSILQEAIEGKLTASWRAAHPSKPGDPERDGAALLEKIREEKRRLIAEGKIRKEKPAAPIAAGEVPFTLPKGWVWCRLPELLDSGDSLRRGPFGSSITKSMFVQKNTKATRIYEQKHAIQKTHSIGDYYIDLVEHPNLKGFIAGPGDIIISCAGTIGETYLLPPEAPMGVINQALLKMRLNPRTISNEYFLHAFAHLTKVKINNDAFGSAMKNIGSVAYLRKELLFPLPPLAEQAAIVEKVESLLAKVEQLEKEVAARKELAAELLRELLREAFEGGA